MPRMVNLNGTWYRQDDVIHMGRSKRDNSKYSVYLEDGRHEEVEEFEYEAVLGSTHVVQVIPCRSGEFVDVYKTADGYEIVPCVMMGLCADGEVRSLDFCEGYCQVNQMGRDPHNFIGVYSTYDLQITGEFGYDEWVKSQESK